MRKIIFYFIGTALICLLLAGCTRNENTVSKESGVSEEDSNADSTETSNMASEEDSNADTAEASDMVSEEDSNADSVEASNTDSTEASNTASAEERTQLETEPYYAEYVSDYDELFSEAMYSAEEWFNEEGKLEFPFDLQITLTDIPVEEKFAIFYIPQEAMDAASTEELFNILKRIPMTRAQIYEHPSDFLNFLSGRFNVTNECLCREDLAETVLACYQSDMFMVKVNSDGEDASEQMSEGLRQESAILLQEVILATDLAFDQMDDTMRMETIEAVEIKRRMRKQGIFECSSSSDGFYGYIGEMMYRGYGSKWYDYIRDQVPDNEQMLELIDNYFHW